MAEGLPDEPGHHLGRLPVRQAQAEVAHRLPKRRGGLGLGEAEHLIQGVEAAPLLPHSVAGDPDPAEGGGHPPGFQALLRPLRSGGRPAVEDPESLAVELPGRPPSLRLDPVLQSDRIEVVLDRHL